MKKSLKKISDMYDSLAGEYAEAFSGEHQKKQKDREMLLKFSGKIDDRKPVWDFGCGPGQTADYLKGLGVEISGMDLSEKMVEQARSNYPGIHFERGNILHLDFEGGSIAGIVCFYAIVHFSAEQVIQAFHEIFRVLQPGGIFLLTYHIGEDTIHLHEFLGKEIDIDFMFFTTEFIVSCLKKSGFEGIEITERDPVPEVEYQSRRAYIFAVKPNED